MEFGATVMRFFSLVISSLLPKLKQLHAERSAGQSPTEIPISIADNVLDAALVRLGAMQPDDPLWKRSIVGIEATVVRPELFRKPSVREWLSKPQVRSALKIAAEASIARSTVSQQVLDQLFDEYAEATGEDRRFAEHPTRIAIAFLQASVQGLTRDQGVAATVEAVGSNLGTKVDHLTDLVLRTGVNAALSQTDIQIALRISSASLLSWPSTLADGTWIHRPELDTLIANFDDGGSSTHLLLGEPGCGKSSLLVRLAHEKLQAGWRVLAIKADRLTPDLLDREALAKHLNLDSDIAAVLRELAKTTPVLVLLDQVDALADLVVQHSARLRVLLDLVRDLSGIDGVHTVISCRTFEQRHDPALRNLDAIPIQLELPEWSTVQPILASRGLQAELWNQDIQQVLRSPHALDIFLSLLHGDSEPAVLWSFHGLLEKQWQVHVLCDKTEKRRRTLRHLASLMAEREVLGLPLVQVEDYFSEIQTLAAAGLLRVDEGPGRVEFRHQTLYEFVRARNFLDESGSLTETVLARQGSLRIRPQLWHALGYFRSASAEDYSLEIGRLWTANLRPHLKMLLIEFLGLQTVPMLAERQLVEQAMTDSWILPRFIAAAVGSQGWFTFLSPIHLPRLMALPMEQAQALLPMLRQALHFSAEEVVDLVGRHWLHDKSKDVLSWQVLGSGDVAPQVGNWLDSLVLVAGRSPIADWAIGHIAGVVSAAEPDAAPKLVAAWLKRLIDSSATQMAREPEQDDSEATDAAISTSVGAVLEKCQFYGMEAIAEAAPKAFVGAVWSILQDGLQFVAAESPNVVVGYRQSSGMLFEDLDDEEARIERPLLRSVQLGIVGWADSDPGGFMEFVATNAQSELLLVHRFLAIGLVRCATHSPQRVFDYLRRDPRRLALGPYSDVHKESVALIQAVGPCLDDPSYAELEILLRDSNHYNLTVLQDDAETRHRRLQWARQHRLRLLKALPEDRRSPALRRLMDEEERAFPGAPMKDVHFGVIQGIGSPVSVDQMNRATDADLLNLFNELTDESAWDHPRHRMKGGAIQAGREFAELAKSNLPKVLRMIRILDPGRNEIPVSCALRELVPAGLTAPALYALIGELEDKGFVGSGFRHDAAYAIANSASKEDLVSDELIDRMERWLVTSATEDDIEIASDAKENSASVLWGHGSMSALPNGNYPTLTALTSACLTAEPPRLDRWLSILERHSERPESSRVWEALIQRELRYLEMAHRSRAESLIDKVVLSAPSVLEGAGWALFVAQAFHWASDSAVQRWLTGTGQRGGRGLQGAGELACLRHAMFPAEDWSGDLLEMFCNDSTSEAAVGVAHGVANLWHETQARPVIHPILLKLIQSTNERVLTALSAIFLRDGFTADVETRELLDALVDCPTVLKNGRAERLPEMLVKLVASEPERVCRLVHTLLDVAGDQIGNIATSWHLSTEWLLDIALQLQDMSPTERAAGSALFERMLEFNMPQVREMTLDLDKRTPVGNSLRAPVRRRPRSKARKTTG